MKGVPIERWEKAQIAESEYSHFHRPGAGELSRLKKRLKIGDSFFEDQAVLEIGAGNGPVYQISNAESRIGIDPLSGEFRDQLRAVQLEKRNHVCTGAAEKLPFESSSVDVVICNNVLDHVFDPPEALNEMRRVMKEQGRLILYVHTFEVPRIIRRCLDYIDPPHPHHFRSAEIENLLADSGFSTEKTLIDPQIPFSGTRIKQQIANGFFRLTDFAAIAYPSK